MALLNSYLTAEQRRTFKNHHVIFVVGRDERVYALTNGHYVYPLCNGRPYVMRHVWACADSYDGRSLSMEGSLLAQLLFLQCSPHTLIMKGCENGVPPDDEERIERAGPPAMVGYNIAGAKDKGRPVPRHRSRLARFAP